MSRSRENIFQDLLSNIKWNGIKTGVWLVQNKLQNNKAVSKTKTKSPNQTNKKTLGRNCEPKIFISSLESERHSVVPDSLWPHELYSPWNSLDQNTRVCSLSLLQGIFPTPGSNPGLPNCRWILYQLSHKESPSST